MLTLLICGVIGIAVHVSAANGQWGAAAIGAVIIAFLLIMRSAAKEDTNAHYNAVQYWAMDGKDRAKARHKWEAQARDEERREAEAREAKRKQELERKADATIRRMQEENAKNVVPDKMVTCAGCGKQAREETRVTYPSGATYVTYTCPWCGEKRTVKI